MSDDKSSVLVQTVTVCISTGHHHSCYRGRYITLNRPDVSAVEYCNRVCVSPCVRYADHFYSLIGKDSRTDVGRTL